MKILLLPGLGDIYWVMTKLESFITKNRLDKPEIYTWELQQHKFNRSAEYINMIPFVTYGGPFVENQSCPEFQQIYFQDTWQISPFRQFDYLLSMNGILRNGHNLDYTTLSEYSTNWYFNVDFKKTENTHGDYIICYFSDDGMFSHTWLKHLPINKIYDLLYDIHCVTKHKMILTGGKWDVSFNNKLKRLDKHNILVNLVGQTSLHELFSLIQKSKGTIGWCGGNTIMSVVFKKPTIIIWSKYFQNEQFFTNCVPPDSVNNWYRSVVVEHDGTDIISKTHGIIT